jgi:hypothetical protein
VDNLVDEPGVRWAQIGSDDRPRFMPQTMSRMAGLSFSVHGPFFLRVPRAAALALPLNAWRKLRIDPA